MTTRNDTLKAYQDYLDATKDLDDTKHRDLTPEELKVRGFGKKMVAVSVLGNLTGLVLLMLNRFAPDTGVGLVTGLLVVTLSTLTLLGGSLVSTYVNVDLSSNKDQKTNAYRKFLDAVSAELSEQGINTLKVDEDAKFITTDRGVVTIATTEGSNVPQILLNGTVIQSSYLPVEQKMVDADGKTIRVPDATVNS